MFAVVLFTLIVPATPGWAGDRAARIPSPVIQLDEDAARRDLIAAFGDLADEPPTLPPDIDPSYRGYDEHFRISGLESSPAQLADFATSMGEGLGTVDAPMLRVLADQALPMFVGYVHALETLERSRPLDGVEAARLLVVYQVLWAYTAMYPTPGEVYAVENGLKIEVDPEVHRRAAWAEGVHEEVWTALRYRLRAAVEGKQEVARGEVELAGELAWAARTHWRSAGGEDAAWLYLSAVRYVAALEPTEERMADVVLCSVHVHGLDGLPKKKHVPRSVRDHDSYQRVVEVLDEWEEIETLRADDSAASRVRTARLLYRRDRETQARQMALSVAVAHPGHAEALTRLAMMHAEGAPRLAHDIVELADPAAEELSEGALAGHFPIRWIQVFVHAAGLANGGAVAVERVEAELTRIEDLVLAAGDRVPVSRAYSALLAEALGQLWVEERAIEDVDLSVHLPMLEAVVAQNPDEHLFLLLLFASRMSPGFEEYGLLRIPLDDTYEDDLRCSLHTERSSAVLAAAVHGLESEDQLEAIAAEVDATTEACGEGPTTSKLQGDLLVLRTRHGAQPPALDDAIPLYQACVHSSDRQEASICRGNLFVIHHLAGRSGAARDAMDALWRCCTDHPPTLYHALFAVGDDRLPGATEWLQTALDADETRNEPERLYMCAGDIARRTGDDDLAAAYWREACDVLDQQRDDGESVLDALPGLFLGNGAMTLNLTGRAEAPIHVRYEQYLRLMANCDGAFVEWVAGGGCDTPAE